MRNVPTHPNIDESSAAGLAQLQRQVTSCLGLNVTESQQRDLLRGAEALANETGMDVGAFLRSLTGTQLTDRQMELLAASLTVGETYFFREPKSLDAFRTRILPELIEKRAGGDKRLRIWSAGCSTGEEAYTVAMILREMMPDVDQWDIHILATDINRLSLEKAQQGIYTEWSFRSISAAHRERSFRQQGRKSYAIRHRFKEMVSFAYLNLASDTYPSLLNNTNARDVIFCRNVLMYFTPELIESVVSRFQRCLVEGGWLIVSPPEYPLVHTSGFAPVSFEDAVLFRNESGKLSLSANGTPRAAIPEWNAQPAADKPVSIAFSSRDEDPLEEAMAYYAKGCYAEAETTLQVLFASDAPYGRQITTGKAYALMARIDANQGKLAQSAEWARKAIAANKAIPGYYYLLATILEEQRQWPEAANVLRRALYLDPEFILAHFALGHIALLEKRHEDARRSFVNAASLLGRMPRDEVLAESEGLTAGRLLAIIDTLTLEKATP